MLIVLAIVTDGAPQSALLTILIGVLSSPRVDDQYAYWGEAPPEPSERLIEWLERFAKGWRRNRRLQSLGAEAAAKWFGVYQWEWTNVLWPIESGACSICGCRPSTVRIWMRSHGLPAELIPDLVSIGARVPESLHGA